MVPQNKACEKVWSESSLLCKAVMFEGVQMKQCASRVIIIIHEQAFLLSVLVRGNRPATWLKVLPEMFSLLLWRQKLEMQWRQKLQKCMRDTAGCEKQEHVHGTRLPEQLACLCWILPWSKKTNPKTLKCSGRHICFIINHIKTSMILPQSLKIEFPGEKPSLVLMNGCPTFWWQDLVTGSLCIQPGFTTNHIETSMILPQSLQTKFPGEKFSLVLNKCVALHSDDRIRWQDPYASNQNCTDWSATWPGGATTDLDK